MPNNNPTGINQYTKGSGKLKIAGKFTSKRRSSIFVTKAKDEIRSDEKILGRDAMAKFDRQEIRKIGRKKHKGIIVKKVKKS